MQETGYGSDEFLRACRLAAACRAGRGQGRRGHRGAESAARAYGAREGGRTLWPWRLTSAGCRSQTLRLTASPRRPDDRRALRDPCRGAPSATAPPRASSPCRTTSPTTCAAAIARRCVPTSATPAARASDRHTPTRSTTGSPAPATAAARRSRRARSSAGWWPLADGRLCRRLDPQRRSRRGDAPRHGVSFAPNARWLLHAAIIERLCGDCEVPGDQQRRCLLHRRRQPALPAPARLSASRRLRRSPAPPGPAPIASCPIPPASLWPPDEPRHLRHRAHAARGACPRRRLVQSLTAVLALRERGDRGGGTGHPRTERVPFRRRWRMSMNQG